MLTLTCAPSGPLGGHGARRPPRSRVEHGRPDAAQHEAAAQRLGRSAADLDLAVGADRDDLGVGAQLGPGIPRRPLELAADASHAADRHVPVPGSAADHVVQEAAVLAQARIVGGRERADEAVGQGDAARDVGLERRSRSTSAERALDERIPERVVAERSRARRNASAAAR